MSRLVLLALTIGVLKIEVKCGTLGKISKFEESLMPRARETLPRNATQLNPELSSLNEALVNASRRTDRAEEPNSSRKGKFLSNIGFLAGVNIGELAAAANTNLASFAKISEAKQPAVSPYVATATFGSYPPVPPAHAVRQNIAYIQRILDHVSRYLESGEPIRNISLAPIPNDIDDGLIDDRRRHKDKSKIKKTASKRRKETKDKEELEELDEYDYDEEQVTRPPKRVPGKQKINAKQTEAMDGADDSGNTTSTNTTNNGNQTFPYHPGYFGGYPQQIGNIGFTYGIPQYSYPSLANSYGLPATTYGPPANSYGPPANSYGPPANSYGTPANSYGTPANSYGTPANTYGPPSNSYGIPSNTYGIPLYANGQFPPVVNGSPFYSNSHRPYFSYGTPQFVSIQDQPGFYDDPSGFSFASPEQWQQYPPLSGNAQFARSAKFVSNTPSPPTPSRNGFVPI